MPNPKPINESAVRIHAINVRSAASRLRSFASSLAMLGALDLSVIGKFPPEFDRHARSVTHSPVLLALRLRARRGYKPGASEACSHRAGTTCRIAHECGGSV